MKQLIKVPSAGESVTQAVVGQWQKKTGDYIRQNDVLVVMETDKASMDLTAEHSGKLNILKADGSTVKIGETIAEIDTTAPPPSVKENQTHAESSISEPLTPAPEKPSTEQTSATVKKSTPVHQEVLSTASSSIPSSSTVIPSFAIPQHFSPAVRKLLAENNLNAEMITGTGPRGRITKADVLLFLEENRPQENRPPEKIKPSSLEEQILEEEQTRRPMTTIRKRIAERLVASQQNTATLTTFNEIDMSQVVFLRSKYKDTFQKKHSVKLGFMGFFIKAVVQALRLYPQVNAYIDGNDMVYNRFCHIGVAVSTDRGLVVPVIRKAGELSLPDLEKKVIFYAEKVRNGKITLDDLTGGTFTISNGGVFGSLMSTPILNPPQSGILGLHKIEQRPVAVNGQVQIKPMMYVALSYDHRIVDGKESVGFLYAIKEYIEDPVRLLIDEV